LLVASFPSHRVLSRMRERFTAGSLSKAAPGEGPDRAAAPVPVLGDGMADWLAYGLEDAFAEQNDMGVNP
jgi:hypothetical protein